MRELITRLNKQNLMNDYSSKQKKKNINQNQDQNQYILEETKYRVKSKR